MAEKATIGRPYARAAFEFAREHGQLPQWSSLLASATAVAADERVSRLLGSPHVQIHFDTGNIMEYQFPEHWIPILGKRIKNVHLKEYTKKGSDHSLEAFRPLLDGTTNWPAVLDAFEGIGYDQYLTFEYFHPYLHHPEALVYQTSDSLDRMLGRKAGI